VIFPSFSSADCYARIALAEPKISWRNIIFEGRKFKSYRGMGSVEAMETVLKTVISRR
jgi:IMP dehydrogenase/GMP reductase